MKNATQDHAKPFFAPHLCLINVQEGIRFYEKAFDAKELRRWSNDDGSVHVAELAIGGALFHMHEESPSSNQLSPDTLKSTTLIIGLFVEDPDAVVKKAVAVGAIETHPIQNYDYGYRQATIRDPFGHQWLIEKEI